MKHFDMFNVFSFVYKQNLFTMLFIIACFIFLWIIIGSIVKHRNALIWRLMNCALLLFSIGIVLFETLNRSGNVFDIELIPFHFLVEARVQPEIYRSVFMNVLLFVPYAVAGKLGRYAVPITVLFAAVLSSGIEFLQYRFHLGRCETDDVIANTLGAAVGSLSYVLYLKIRSNRERSGGVAGISLTQKNLLSICGTALFGGELGAHSPDYPEILKEATQQTVLPIIESVIRKDYANAQPRAIKVVAKNIRVVHEHIKLHELMHSAGIPYVILKGCASARYYKEPLLRTMGDVDFIVDEKHFPAADRALRQAGFVPEKDSGSLHIGYQRNLGGKKSICEMHRSLNGIPAGEVGDKARALLNDIIDRAVFCDDGYFVPSDFHHGLVLLLHTASHLTHEGVGLRHLCDWAVFADSFSDDKFCAMFEQPLKLVGLWEFARALTAVCVRHLGAPERKWAAGVDNTLTDALILDILNGGNFGKKDIDRYNQIKFIANRDDNKVDSKPALLQLFYSLNQKAKQLFPAPALRPVGWVAVSAEYLYMLIIGKRSIRGIKKTISDAEQRKAIYQKLELFKNQ